MDGGILEKHTNIDNRDIQRVNGRRIHHIRNWNRTNDLRSGSLEVTWGVWGTGVSGSGVQ